MATRTRRDTRGFADDTDASIGYLVRDAARRILDSLAVLLAEHGISIPQYFVMRELYAHEGLTQRELANRVGVLEPTIVATLDALERNGLVERQRRSSDRRKASVMLTPAGEAMRDTLLGYAESVLERALQGVSDEAIASMRASLQRIKANLA